MSPRLIRRYTELLGLFDRGEFLSALDQTLTGAIEGLENNAKGQGVATVTVTVKIAYQKGILNFYPSFDVKTPKIVWGVTPAWAVGGAISVQHPDQHALFEGPRVIDHA